ncbi:importin N-terminal domain-containing protein, partial [Haematococcus lacustris]
MDLQQLCVVLQSCLSPDAQLRKGAEDLLVQVDAEELVFTLETLVQKFGTDIAPYAAQMMTQLVAAFNNIAAYECLRAINTLLDSLSGLGPELYLAIEDALLPLVMKLLSTDGQDVVEESSLYAMKWSLCKLHYHLGDPTLTPPLLRVAAEESVDIAVRQVAAITFKRLVRRSWDPPASDTTTYRLPEDEKTLVKDNILESLTRAPHAAQVQLGEVFKTIVYNDFPANWPGLQAGLVQNLASQEPLRVHGGLYALRLVVRKYEMRDSKGEEADTQAALVNATFPVLLHIFQQLLASPALTPDVCLYIKLVLKCFWSATYMAPPDLLLQPEHFRGWMAALLAAVLEMLAYLTFFGPGITPKLWSTWPLMHAMLMDWAIDSWDSFLIPLDNMITRDTHTFLHSKDPNYLESVFQLASHSLSGDYSDKEVVPAAKLLQLVLQTCRGSIDNWVGPYIGLALQRLPRTEHNSLKDSLVQVVAAALYYNPLLTLRVLVESGTLASFFSGWVTMILATRASSGKAVHFRSMQDKKVCILGLLALVGGVPAESLPAEVASSSHVVLSGAVTLLT